MKLKQIMKQVVVLTIITTLVVPLFCTEALAWSAKNTKCYTISSGNTNVYSNSALTGKKYGTIYGSDEITILASYSNGSYKVRYPIKNGKSTKTGYIAKNAVLSKTTGSAKIANKQIPTYKRPGGASYGYVSKGDKVTLFGTNGEYTQLQYPVNGGYKFGWVKWTQSTTDNYVNISNGTYIIESAVKSGKVMDVDGDKNANGTNIQIWDSHGGNNQKFNITSVGNGWYKIICVSNRKAIDVENASSSIGTNVQLYDDNGTYAQQWKFYSAGNGYYYIKNRLGNYLDVNGAYSDNGTNIHVWEKNTSNAQKWKLNTTSVTVIKPETYYVTTQAGLSLRSSASTSSTRLLTIPYGAAISVSSISNGWAKCTYNGRSGYCSTQYISKNKPVISPGNNNGFVINGKNIGYAPGSFFTDNGKACTDHSVKGKHSYYNEKACNCICTYNGKSLGAVQCFGFARYVQTKIYGVNSYSNAGSFYKLNGSNINANSLTASKLKKLIKASKPGAHLRTKGSAHSMIITNITDSGFSIIQCNGSNNREYSGHQACRIGTYTYTWNSYLQSTYGKRGIEFIELKR